MILIISTERDASTDDVIDWLVYYECEIIRLNAEDLIDNFIFNYDNYSMHFILETKEKKIDSRHVDVIWYRKNGFNFNFKIDKALKISKSKKKEIQNRELGRVREFVEYYFINKPLLGKSILTKDLNKLIVLNLAKQVGFKIPETYIVNKKENVNSKSMIVKAISDVFFIDFGKKRRLITYTADFTNKKENLAPHFFPTVFQEKIDKEFEIRIFHLLGKNYSIAIFSQSNNQTEIDYRKYDLELPNRTVPYKLNNDFNSKINILMNKLNLDTASLDFIVDKSGEVFFLEVNPAGQFGMVSIPGHFMLERKIAQILKNKLYEIEEN